jgi:MoxR-like ATPase
VSYAVKLARSTRPDSPEAPANIKKYVSWGAGPRASQYLILGAKARAAMDGRAMPDLEDVAAMAQPVLSHRVVVNFQAEAEVVSATSLNGPLARLHRRERWVADSSEGRHFSCRLGESREV